jgi:ferredoxin-NADP reductase
LNGTIGLEASRIGEMSDFNQESVLSVHHWTDTLFSFTTTRDPSFRFRNGEFTMIGLKVGEKPLLRAYSVASARTGWNFFRSRCLMAP